MLIGTPTSNAQLKHERSMTINENTQYARLVIVVASAPKLGKRRASDGAASITCIDDNTMFDFLEVARDVRPSSGAIVATDRSDISSQRSHYRGIGTCS
jgi:hypothetical protein